MTTSVTGITRRTFPRREPRKTVSDAPRQPHIKLGLQVLIVVPCDVRGCRSWRHGQDSRYVGVIEGKRGDSYLVVTWLYGSFWAKREHMYVRDHNGKTFTTPLLVKDPV